MDTSPNDRNRSVGRGTEVSETMYFSYVIYSSSHDRFYKGHCKNLDIRINEHNAGRTKSTKSFIPWILYYFEAFETECEAINREKYFKTAAGRRFLKKAQHISCK